MGYEFLCGYLPETKKDNLDFPEEFGKTSEELEHPKNINKKFWDESSGSLFCNCKKVMIYDQKKGMQMQNLENMLREVMREYVEESRKRRIMMEKVAPSKPKTLVHQKPSKSDEHTIKNPKQIHEEFRKAFSKTE